ncbi:MAG: TolC family outer membrane protein [Polaromonas sp.]|uniref:TolC family outer membrane protein n=1 Tax=Polaromonas sp. TaxID=1869339 RepID=UPI0027316AEF|nr:TolC family outer membrane protein [Polaromonas sp.]MDP2448052.1 TolC family outer membrane protein [Polaromonas sp.]MDP3249305.1 TolC family outer membrane protein [Polaromonas sp.]MDP3755261.1 TolC family outer membrane protein [Polaromonas sp.]
MNLRESLLAPLVAGTFLHGQRVAVPCRLKNTLAALMLVGVGFGALPLVIPAPAFAQATGKPLTLKEAAQNAVLNNPEVLARWHTIKAADGERDAGAGALLPKVDLAAGSGAERRNAAATTGTRFDRNSASLTITQLLYDGFATRNDVKRLDHARLVRLFEFFDTSESVALEAVRAYYDVLRYRELLRLAEDNFVQHRSVFDQTERRVKAKVARAVDLEQIAARLAMAESNLLTETSNLHDTTARFQRIVGLMPTRDMPVPAPLMRDIPEDASGAIRSAQQRNGALRASVENVRASNAALASRSGAYQPRFDLRLRREQGANLNGVTGNTDATVAEVVMSWNLFNGFGDRARERQFAEQLNVAKDLRDKTCRDIRQTLLIAYNDSRKLKEQLGYLDQNKVSVEKARNAYRQQFDIGQRTLLDLLDTENELFQARRAVVNAEQDLNIAYARTQAGLGTLLPALELSRIETGGFPGLDRWNDGEDASQHCPAEPVSVYVVDKGALIQRAADQVKETALFNARERAVQEVFAPTVTPLPPAGGRLAPAPAPVTPATPVAPPAPVVPPADSGSSELQRTLEKQTALANARERTAQQALASAPAARPAMQPTPWVAPKPAAVAEPAPAAMPEAGSSSEISNAVEGWRAAWSRRDVEAYLGFYAPGFVPSNDGDRDAWKEKRKEVLGRAVDISVEVSELSVATPDATHATATFRQTYRSANYRDVVTKTLQWVRVGDRWLIVRESSVTPVQGIQ